jgi:hypothetical protein
MVHFTVKVIIVVHSQTAHTFSIITGER